MKVHEKNFREMYRQICLLIGEELIKKINLREVFDYPPDENLNGFLTYSCINLNGEFVFEILAGAKFDGEQIKIFPASYKKNIQLLRAEVETCEVKIFSDNYAAAFKDKIQMIDDAFKVDSAKEKIRAAESLDELRHPNFPDDVAVLFSAENFRPEYAWVRCESFEEKFIVGILLNELQQNFGCKVGEKIKFGLIEFEGENICVSV